MTNAQKVTNKEFNDIDQALRRAAQTAKKLAEQNGTPYVVYRESSAGKVLSNPTQSKK
jgi:Ribonuclease G/E